MTGPIDSVAIVGGGFSGAMLAARLAERGAPSILINRTADFGLGVAYSTPFDGHLLNVRSARMSALAEDPGHFVRWLQDHHPSLADPDGFAPRRLFGLYVQSRLAEVEARHPGRIQRRIAEVAAIVPEGVRLDDGAVIAADAVVLTTGNPAPRTAGPAGSSNAVVPDPWAPGALGRIAADDDILLIGTGLTMVDVLLSLNAGGWRGRATALSRRGLLPRGHRLKPDSPTSPTEALLSGRLSTRLSEARRLSDLGGWREVMEGLRPITARLWGEADLATRSRVVRHLRPWWDVHRHRVAPAVAAVIEGLCAEGRLDVVAGRVRTVTSDEGAVRLDWTPRHGPARPALGARWLIDCSGPGHAPDADPLTAPLIASGRARLDPLGLGLELDPGGRVLNAAGDPDSRLFVLGPPARAAFWETIAVPDIRKRIEDVVTALTAQA
ncbi:FAD/NAD(P)-binding protein [Brevundimonas subvibrioides]|uniref:FAD dependent oxidoreductase n=1 Tax=Brevundimonas subvibrioides (strain ATCC 15264 / DSM 4735 / LMG 14903 / NBRC 16000 / CB 81) TaxID=633149 RepID=D9QKH0_BRESC|nr:FAD/NAD(P)-binding protein [Brevundimonas subvibrioides]ADK99795.1 FAD dependent oxidoreductase [Brevundimonas subvibrioides ATCC 15264]